MNIFIYDNEDRVITIDAAVISGQRGTRDYYGQMETPDDHDEIEILEAYYEDGTEVNLTAEQIEDAEATIWEELSL